LPPFYQSLSRLGIRETLIRECEFRGEPRAHIVRRHVRVLPIFREEKYRRRSLQLGEGVKPKYERLWSMPRESTSACVALTVVAPAGHAAKFL
jgi:hypothetical protein